MPIPEDQLATWAKQGSVTQSASTYATIKRALEAESAAYQSRNFEVFLQGSYGNDTNIFAESDVDTVIRYDSAFFHDLSELTPGERSSFSASFSDGAYAYDTFKADVLSALRSAFGSAVTPGNKVFNIAANGSRRKADVIVAFEFRRYFRFNGQSDQNFEPGICFFRGDGIRIANFPKQHTRNCTAKHQATGNNFKPLVRIMKNLRSKLVDDGMLADGVAPSYFIEGLLYNVPDDQFAGSYQDMVCNCINWLNKADRTNLLCVNEQYYLLRADPVCWSADDCQQFLSAVVHAWDHWG